MKVFHQFFRQRQSYAAAARCLELLRWRWLDKEEDAVGFVWSATAIRDGLRLDVEVSAGGAKWWASDVGSVSHPFGMHEGTWGLAPAFAALFCLDAEAAAAEHTGEDTGAIVRPCLRCKWALSRPGARHCGECQAGAGRSPIRSSDIPAIILATLPAPPVRFEQLALGFA